LGPFQLSSTKKYSQTSNTPHGSPRRQATQLPPLGGARDAASRSQKLWTISLIVRELDKPFYTAIALGAMTYAAKKGCIVIIASSEGDHTVEERITESFLRKHIKGAIIAPVLEGDAEIEHFFRLRCVNFPFVLLEHVKGIQANVVSIDNTKAMRNAVQYLLDLGHRHIVHFAGPRHALHTFERIQGFHRAFTESRLVSREDLIVYAGAEVQDGYDTCMQYFSGRSQDACPTAIVCYNDLVAFGVMTALNELRIKVPKEISIVGNDDITFSSRAPVKLTTVRAPLFDLGSRAAEILIQNIESQHQLPIENILLDAELIVRESARPPRDNAVEKHREESHTISGVHSQVPVM
jgi:DNA-binding LacI/PurR family transcriptional regulator